MHEVAQAIAPQSRVVYVDNDPIVHVHASALLTGSGTTSIVLGDLRDPEIVLACPKLRALVDFGQPVGLLLVAQLREALADVAPGDREAIGQLIVVVREFRAWAVWLPHQGGQWTATRPASSRAPGPELPMVWVDAMTATDLARRMRAVDEQLAGRWPC